MESGKERDVFLDGCKRLENEKTYHSKEMAKAKKIR